MGDWLDDFDADALRAWASDLGIDTYVGSSGRVFPMDRKAAPLLLWYPPRDPEWLVAPLKEQLGEDFWPLVAAMEQPAPLDLAEADRAIRGGRGASPCTGPGSVARRSGEGPRPARPASRCPAQARPRRTARAAAAVREATPSLPRMLLTWVITVR